MIKLDNLTYTYPNGTKALDGINLTINEGEILLVIGKNGSGKSTLLSCISNIYKYKGNIYLDDINIKKVPNEKFREEIGIVFQDPNNQIIFNRVYDDILFALDNLGLDNKDERIKEALEIVSMSEFIDANPYNLSLGQKQRIALASVLATKPKYLLLDEVTSYLDYQGKKDIYQLMLRLKEKGIGIILGTNILDELIYADKVIILNQEIKEVLTKKELFSNLNLLKQYGFSIPFNLKVIDKIGLDKININHIKEDDLLEHIN